MGDDAGEWEQRALSEIVSRNYRRFGFTRKVSYSVQPGDSDMVVDFCSHKISRTKDGIRAVPDNWAKTLVKYFQKADYKCPEKRAELFANLLDLDSVKKLEIARLVDTVEAEVDAFLANRRDGSDKHGKEKKQQQTKTKAA
jgi:hypothetical protein